ncbi:MAG TPA: zf-HC2 domain-containing protein, partial [Pyrinomonadaceae bacterium]|nr:zf-HC2 domain-containing protein [Pyrinomonadaceae bacterium]
MIEGFDKEMDFLLRRAAKGESAQTFDAHPDADEISLFAENALTAKARERAAVHLAECTKCRKILSNVILFNAESESETIHAAEAESKLIPAAAAPLIPWYRRLFAFPQITFAMGALVLVFSGVIAFLVLQNSSDIEQNATVARNEEFTEKSRGTGGASSDGETETIETYSANSSNAASANPSLMSNSNATSTANTVANSMNASADSFSGNVAAPALRQSPQAVAKNESANEIARPENSLPADARRN